MFALLIGGINSAMKFVGPFEDKDVAAGYLADDEQWVIPLIGVEGETESEGGDEDAVLFMGDPAQGFLFYGPFASTDLAHEFGIRFAGVEWWIENMKNPD